MTATEAFSRVRIDARLRDAGWDLEDGGNVRFEHALPDGSRADYALFDGQGRPLAVVEAKRASVELAAARDQGLRYAERLGAPFVFLSNGAEVRFLDRGAGAHPRPVAGFFAQDDLKRRAAARAHRKDPRAVPIDRGIAGRDYQIDCIEALTREVALGRRKLPRRDGDRRRQDAHGRRLRQAPVPGGPRRCASCSSSTASPSPARPRRPSPTICPTTLAASSAPAAASTAPQA